MLTKRTKADNRQLAPGETQFESVRGAVSAEAHGPVVRITTVRGLEGRKAQFADLDAEALDAFIAHLIQVRSDIDTPSLATG